MSLSSGLSVSSSASRLFPPPPSSESRPATLSLALTLLALVTLFRLWYATKLGLFADETYYWMWSRHLAASYSDKGPLIAWLIAAGTWVFGDTPFGVRWLGVLMGSWIGWEIFRLARRFYGDRVALWSLVVALIIPLFAVGSIIMTIDTPSVLCWVWAANVFATALESGKLRHWFGLGFIIGIGFLAKFTNGVQLACIALYLLWSAPHRRYLFSRQTLVMVVAFVLCSLPILWWNMQVGWLQAAALHSRSGLEDSFRLRPKALIRFLGEHLGAVSPLLGLGLIVAGLGLLVSRRDEEPVRFLLCQFLPLYAVFGFFSLSSPGKANWPAPALAPGVVALVVCWRDQVSRRPAWFWGVGTALWFAALMTIGMHALPFARFPDTFPLAKPLRGLMKRSQGWPDFAAHVQRAREQYQPQLLIANHYAKASLAQFYLPDHPKIYEPTGWHPQFELWGGYQVHPGTRALFITDDIRENPDDLGLPLTKEFTSHKLVDDFWTQYNGLDMAHIRIYLLTSN